MSKVTTTDLRILKAKLKQGLLIAEYEMRETVTELNEHTQKEEMIYKSTTNHKIESTRFIHEDMIKAFLLLDPHVALLCELEKQEEWEDFHTDFETGDIFKHPRLEKFRCTGISIGGEDEHEGVVLVGRKALKNKRVLNLTSPFTKFVPSEHEEGYNFADEMMVGISRVVEEVKLFINEGKCAADPQLSIFEEDGSPARKEEKEDKDDMTGSTLGYTVAALVTNDKGETEEKDITKLFEAEVKKTAKKKKNND